MLIYDLWWQPSWISDRHKKQRTFQWSFLGSLTIQALESLWFRYISFWKKFISFRFVRFRFVSISFRTLQVPQIFKVATNIVFRFCFYYTCMSCSFRLHINDSNIISAKRNRNETKPNETKRNEFFPKRNVTKPEALKSLYRSPGNK
jgi:hypothetical protein